MTVAIIVCPQLIALIVVSTMLVFLIAMATTLVPRHVATIEGNWSNPNGSVIINIASCGDAFCGRVFWASEEAQEDARKGGTESLVGTELLSGFTPRAKGGWSGQAFVPDLNKRSKAEIHQLGPDKLKVIGCAVGRILCRSQVWTRATAQFQ